MTKRETTDINELLYTTISLILSYYTYKIFLWYFRICATLWLIWLIIWPFIFVDWLIDFKRRRRRRSKKIHRRIARTLCAVFSIWTLIFWCSKIGIANEKFKEWSEWISEYSEIFVSEKWKLWLKPNVLWIAKKVLNNMNTMK